MFLITGKDKAEILKILLEHNCKCKMSELVREYSYLNDKKSKKGKIKNSCSRSHVRDKMIPAGIFQQRR